ncbi:MAG: Replicative helicase [Pseudomonadota bacterium]|jgi:replicative DNA helicase
MAVRFLRSKGQIPMRSQAEWETPRPAQAHLKTMPHATESEQSVLGGLLLDNQAWFQLADLIVESDFYHPNHAAIFRAISALSAQNVPFDVITVSDWLEKQQLLSKAGGFEYLVNVARNTPSAANITTYAEIVRECSVLRQLNRVGTEITNSTFNAQGRSPNELLEEAEKQIFAIAEQTNRKGGFLPIRQILTKAIDKIDELFQKNTSITGISSGFSDLDDKTAGLQPSDLIIIAGRPSMGKTSFAMNIAENVAVGSGLPVAVFSLEMPGEQLAMRLIASLGRIDQQKVRTGRLEDDDWPRLTMAINMLAETKLFIDDTPGVSPSEIRARARRLVREEGQLGLIVIDYLQLMQLSGGKENRATEISEISRALKSLAKELQVPVIALSQLNRGVEHRQDKRPQLADLRESGAIEQDADLVMFIYRDEVYNEESPDKGTAEIIIAKQRNGPIGMVRLAFRGQFTRFENFAAEQYYSEE